MNFKETPSRAHIRFIASSHKQLPNINVSGAVEQQQSLKQHQRPALAERQLLRVRWLQPAQGRPDPGRAAPPPARTRSYSPAPAEHMLPLPAGCSRAGTRSRAGKAAPSSLGAPRAASPPGIPLRGRAPTGRPTPGRRPARPRRPSSTCSLLRSRQGGSVPSPRGSRRGGP